MFSPVLRYSSLRYLFGLAAKYDLDIDQMDVVTAFLHGELDEEEIYMEQPEMFYNGRNGICLLKRAFCGLKQSSRV